MKSVIIRVDDRILFKIRRLKSGVYETLMPTEFEGRTHIKIILDDNTQVNLQKYIPKGDRVLNPRKNEKQ